MMKKIMLTVLITTCFFLNVDALECSDEQIKTLSEQLSNFTLSYKLMENGTSIEYIDFDGELVSYDVSNLIETTVQGLPQNFSVFMYTKNFPSGRIFSDDDAVYLDGGVYDLEFYHTSCPSDVIKKMQLYVPVYNTTNEKEDKWFDGTYEQKSEENQKIKKEKVNIALVVILISLVIALVILVLFLFNRKRQFE